MSSVAIDQSAWGVDVGINVQGDLSVGPTGDLTLATGPSNLVQALRLRMLCAIGELALHPEYGSALNSEFIGQKNSSFAVNAELQNEMTNLITQDTRFIAADIVSFAGDGPTSIASIQVTVVDGTQLTVSTPPTISLIDITSPIFDDIEVSPLDDITESSFFAEDEAIAAVESEDLITQLASNIDDTQQADLLS